MARGEAEAVEEFLKKLASDQDRMRKHIQGQGLRFRKMGAAVNRTLASKGRIFLLGEDILEDVARIIGEEYFRLWPVVSLSLSRPENNDLSSIERDEASVAEGLPEHVVDMARRFHSGDAVLAFVHQGRSRALCALLEEAKRRGVSVLVIGGLDARASLRGIYDTYLSLPTRGIKTICEASFLCARLVGRFARANRPSQGGSDEGLMSLECPECHERVFVEHRYAGKRGSCPICKKKINLPERGLERRKDRSSGISGFLAAADSGSAQRPGSAASRAAEAEASAPVSRAWGELVSSERPPIEPEHAAEAKRGAEPRDGDDSLPTAMPTSAPATPLESFELAEPVLPDEESQQDPLGISSGSDTALFEGLGSDDALVPSYLLDGPGLDDPEAPPTEGLSTLEASDDRDRRRVVSNRYDIRQCELCFAFGAFPDESVPRHTLLALDSERVSFELGADDAAAILSPGDELWLRIEVPAFLEPILTRASIEGFESHDEDEGLRVLLLLQEKDPECRRRLALAAERLAISQAH